MSTCARIASGPRRALDGRSTARIPGSRRHELAAVMASARRALIVGRRFTAARQWPAKDRSLNERSGRTVVERNSSDHPVIQRLSVSGSSSDVADPVRNGRGGRGDVDYGQGGVVTTR